MQAGLAGAQLQLQLGRSDDNLARIATLLRTTTDERTAALNLPLPVWFGDGVPASRWPMLAWTWQTVHQRAANAPLTADSGFAASHLPDQFNRTQQINFGWTLARGSLGYTLAHSWQDNRQPGRERADFANLSHQLSWAWGVSDALRVNLGLNRSRNHSYETSLTRHTLGGTVGADWQVNERWSLAGSLSANHADDSERRAESDSLSAQLQATRNFKLPWLGGVQPGQAFVRLARQGDRSQDNVFTQATDQRSWWIDVGVSFSLF